MDDEQQGPSTTLLFRLTKKKIIEMCSFHLADIILRNAFCGLQSSIKMPLVCLVHRTGENVLEWTVVKIEKNRFSLKLVLSMYTKHTANVVKILSTQIVS